MKSILLFAIIVSASYADITLNSFMNSTAGSLIIGFVTMVLPVAIIMGLVKIWWIATDQDGKEEEKRRIDREKARKEWNERKKKGQQDHIN